MIVVQRSLTVLLLFFAAERCVVGDIRLPKIFADNMVLQHGGQINIWGTAEPGESLTITLGEKTASATADDDGKWASQIDSPEKAGGPYTLAIKGAESSVVFEDVLLGEVWLCSGQSNMEWSVQNALNANVEAELADYPNIRLFTVKRHPSPEPLSECNGVILWQPCSEQSVRSFSAVAYFFGRHLRSKLNKPIGLIHSSWGGTRCEAWTSREAMNQVESLKPLLEHWDAKADQPTNPARPGILYNGMISPITPFSIKGVIWYQGESNVGRAKQYATLFPTMITDWRAKFKNPEMPFYFVQLAPYKYGNRNPAELAELWDSQLQTLNTVENTGMAVTTDIGNVLDIHPRNKQAVGRRLALWALSDCYGKSDVHCSGPIYKSKEIDGNRIRISFTHADGGLIAKGNSLTHFQICGEDGQFKPASATIEGNQVVVSAPDIENPIHVRFAWDQMATPNLFGKASALPASPFRTDQYEMLSEGKDF